VVALFLHLVKNGDSPFSPAACEPILAIRYHVFLQQVRRALIGVLFWHVSCGSC
jgi:hypothetical protein